MAKRSGVITMTGSALALADQSILGQLVYFWVDKDNADPVYIGNDGADTVASTTGGELHVDGLIGLELHQMIYADCYVIGTNAEKLYWVQRG